MGKRKTNEEFLKEVHEKNEYVKSGQIEILGTYAGRFTPIKSKCITHNCVWYPTPAALYKGCGCKQCGNDKISQLIIMSHKEFMDKVLLKNEYIKNNDIEIIGEYNGADNPIECVCHVHNLVFYSTPSNLYRGQGCKRCGYDKIALARRTPHEEFVQKVNSLCNNITVVGKYINNHTHIEFQCDKGHIWSAVPSSILSGYGCPYCSGLNVIVGETSLYDTRPDVIDLLEDKQDGYKYSAGSRQKINFVCPDCKTVHLKRIVDVCKKGLSCSNCSDGISYAEKFMNSILTQLKVNFKKQISKTTYGFEWIKCGYRYDFYVECFDDKFFIEMDGGIGHGHMTFNGEKDADGIKRDKLKDEMASEHNIKMIRIDCDYHTKDRFEYIKNNILNSEFSNIFDLSTIDWALCDKQAQKKIIAQVAELYNNGYTLFEMINVLRYNKKSIQNWLRKSKKLGLCDYDAKELANRDINLKKNNCIAVNRYTKDNKYVNSYVSLTMAALDIGCDVSNIHRACDKSSRSAGGYKYYRADNPHQPDKTKIINSTIQN